MSLTSGFFNSVNGDRKYNAEQMSSLFNGIINDGVFSSIGNTFAVTALGSLDIAVGTGRAWFDSAWIDNDTSYTLTAGAANAMYNRYDAVVIEVNHTNSVRSASIKIVQGTAASSPQYPTLTDSGNVHQHPLAYIYRAKNSTTITQANITNCVGSSACPYITGILQTANLDQVFAQWEAEWDEWSAAQQAEAVAWLETLQSSLEGNVAVELSNRISTLETKLGSFDPDDKVSKTGDTMSDYLSFNPGDGVSGTSKVGRESSDSSQRGLLLMDMTAANAAGSSRALRISADDDVLQLMAGGTGYNVYTERNKPTATDVGALPISGGTVTGNLASNGTITANNTSTAYGLSKVRTISGVNYTVDVGVGNDSTRGASASMRLKNGSETVKGRLDLWNNGTFTYSSDGSTYIDLLYSYSRSTVRNYTGTGTYGSGNPSSATCEFTPRMLMWLYSNNDGTEYSSTRTVCGIVTNLSKIDSTYKTLGNCGGRSTAGENLYLYLKYDGTKLYWYHTVEALRQFNVSGKVYSIIILGNR